MKKIISIVLILVTILSFVGCSDTSIEEQIVSDGKKSMRGFKPVQDTITIQKSDDEIVINLSKAERYYEFYDVKENDCFSFTNIKKITSSTILKTISSSKELIVNYINESLVLTDKEELISYINNLPFNTGDFPDISYVAGFDPKTDTVFVNIENPLLDEHTIVHELFHALSYKTRVNSNWFEYSRTLFDEAFTELLASSVIKPNYSTVYDEYIEYIYQFIGSHGLEAIRTYFYGIDEEKIPNADFNLYAVAIECLNEAEAIQDKNAEKLTLHLILSKWILEK